jgi:glycosyltransferase involved in cell wall biosynthesis
MPLVSIVTPSLNQGAFLERTIRSVLDQGYPAIEHIVIDGGSSDASLDILKHYDRRLAYWVSEPDRGQAHAINKGIERASGEIVAYINSDDYYLPHAIEAAVSTFTNSDVRWVVGRCRYERADGTLESLFVPAAPRGPRAAWIRAPWYVPQASSFWHCSIFADYGLLREDLTYVLDSEYAVRLAMCGVRPLIIDQELAVRYLHDAAKSADSQHFSDEWSRLVPDFERMLRWRDRAHDVLTRSALSARKRVPSFSIRRAQRDR